MGAPSEDHTTPPSSRVCVRFYPLLGIQRVWKLAQAKLRVAAATHASGVSISAGVDGIGTGGKSRRRQAVDRWPWSSIAGDACSVASVDIGRLRESETCLYTRGRRVPRETVESGPCDEKAHARRGARGWHAKGDSGWERRRLDGGRNLEAGWLSRREVLRECCAPRGETSSLGCIGPHVSFQVSFYIGPAIQIQEQAGRSSASLHRRNPHLHDGRWERRLR